MCFRCMLGGSFSCWMKQYDRPSVIHLCLSVSYSLTRSCTHIHAHTHACSLRKSCFIYETYSPESHKDLLGFQDCTHTVFLPVQSLFFSCSHTYAAMHACCGASVCPICCFGWAEPLLFYRDLGLPLQRSESCRLMVAECGALVFRVAGVQRKVCYHLNVRGAEKSSYAQAILNQCRNSKCLGKCQARTPWTADELGRARVSIV